jgi:hypothetical protein
MNLWKRHTVALLYAIFLGVAGVLALVILAPPPANVKIAGTLTLGGATDTGLSGVAAGDTCSGRRSLADIAGGSKVTVYSGNSATALQTSVLEDGKVDKFGNCIFKFSLSGVSKVKNYSIAIGQRPRYNYGLADLVSMNYNLKLTFGEVSDQELKVVTAGEKGGSASKNYQLQDVNGSQTTSN